MPNTPQFDRVNGVFTTRLPDGRSGCSFEQRLLFLNAGWKFNQKSKGWTTPDIEKAKEFYRYAVGAAKEHLDNAAVLDRMAVQASWAEDTDTAIPCPEGLNYFPFQKSGIEYALGRKNTLVADPPGLGKSQPVTEPVLTPNGWVNIGNISTGDCIIGSDGLSHHVTGVFPQGQKETYEITFKDGSKAKCSDMHLWNVKDSNRRKRKQNYTTKTLHELMNRDIQDSGGKNKWNIPLVSPVNFCEQIFIIPPYTLGVLLGDGSLQGTSPCVSIAANEGEIKEKIESELLGGGYRLHSSRASSSCAQYTISRPNCGPNSSIYVQELDRLQLRVHGSKKRIPEAYLIGSISQRLDLLRGLMDSDGSAHKNRIVFHTKNVLLGKGVQQLVWSLGGESKLRTYHRTGGKGTEYQISVKLNDFCPFYLSRKAKQWWPSKRNGPKRFIKSVKKMGCEPHVCISVSAKDCLYVTSDYTLTHNTVQAIGVHNAERADRVLIIPPASLKVNWSREWQKWDIHGKSVGIAHSKRRTKTINKVRKSWTEHVFPDTDVVIVNYDMLDTFDDQIKSIHWNLVIADECHLLKNDASVRTMCVFGGKRKALRKDGKLVRAAKKYAPIESDRMLLLTGTPILSRPIELWNIIKACDPKGLGASWEKYVYQYCDAQDGFFGLDTSGASNLDELSRLLREKFMVRRDKRAVLKELPDKTREPIMLPQDKLEKVVKKEKTRLESALSSYEKMLGLDVDTSPFRFIEILEDLGDKIQKALDAQSGEEPDWDAAIKSLSAPDQIMFTEMSAAREEVALAKIGMVADHIKGLVDSNEPVIVFGYHKSVINELYKRLTEFGLKVGVITGSVPSNKRQNIVDDFQKEQYDVILGNIIAMGVGFTLTRARFVVFAELDWVPAMMEQAEDRAWRIGQINAVIAQYLLVDGSIEAIMALAILEKMGIISEALDSAK